MTMVIVAAGIDLSVGSIIALSHRGHRAPAQARREARCCAALGGVAGAALCGLANGVLITRLKVVPFIVTLGTMLIVRGAAKGLADERRIEARRPGSTACCARSRPGRGLFLPLRDLDPAVLALLVAGVLRYTVFGRHLFAIGSNERTARLCGVRVERVKVAVYTISAALAGVAGSCSSRSSPWATPRSRWASSWT
jgi:ribose/xylose/arabinose/galactoside ABC-type transport system permease subunit